MAASFNCFMFIILIASVNLVVLSWATYTLPNLPFPSFRPMSKFLIVNYLLEFSTFRAFLFLTVDGLTIGSSNLMAFDYLLMVELLAVFIILLLRSVELLILMCLISVCSWVLVTAMLLVSYLLGLFLLWHRFYLFFRGIYVLTVLWDPLFILSYFSWFMRLPLDFTDFSDFLVLSVSSLACGSWLQLTRSPYVLLAGSLYVCDATFLLYAFLGFCRSSCNIQRIFLKL